MEVEEEKIEMKGSLPPNFLNHSDISSPSSKFREFEFQMSFCSNEKDTSTSPADDLFYKGKLLPLLLPPRLQMVEKLLQNSSSFNGRNHSFDDVQFPIAPAETSTPFEFCNVSHSESCPVSRELNPDDYFLECSLEEEKASSFNGENAGKSWATKLAQSSIVKLKASKAYLKSLFRKSGCSYASTFAKALKTADEGSVSKAKKRINRYIKMGEKIPFEKMQKEKNNQILASFLSLSKEKMDKNGIDSHRRSFTTAPNSTSNSSSSSESSFSSSRSNDSRGFSELQFLKRSGSQNSDTESPIQGAIAHCKRSQFQKLFDSKKTVGGVRCDSLSPARIAE